MKKEWIITFVFGILITLLLNVSLVHAQTTPGLKEGVDPSDPSSVIGSEFGINPDKIPQDPEDIQRDFLQKEWTKVIENNSFFGPIHRSFVSHPLVFTVVFNHVYEFSLTFFLIIALWFLFLAQIEKFLTAKGMKKEYSFLLAIGLMLLVSRTKFVEFLVVGALNIAMKPDAWYLRTIFLIMMFGALGAWYVFIKIITQKMTKKRKEEKEQEVDRQLLKMKSLSEGMKEVPQE